MNKKELADAVAKKTDMTATDAASAVDAVFDVIQAALKKKDDVRLIGFGTFSVSRRKARTGRNPQTGEAIKIKASNQASFKAGKGLKDALN
ncbi:UNVERIFIED_CONTAM: hypothetical protein GTU68_050585 [Idotea baltica]|nr:hypothetical protein [Idotea baltica]